MHAGNGILSSGMALFVLPASFFLSNSAFCSYLVIVSCRGLFPYQCSSLLQLESCGDGGCGASQDRHTQTMNHQINPKRAATTPSLCEGMVT